MNTQGQESLSPDTTTQATNSLHLDPSVVDRFKMLNLHHPSATPPISAAARRFRRLRRCNTCGSLKKRSPFMSATAGATTTTTESSSRRCNCKPPSSAAAAITTTGKSMNQVSDSSTIPEEGFKKSDDLQGLNTQVSSIPTVSKPLFRSFSDPISPVHQKVEELTTPPRPAPLLRTRSFDQETPNSKKLRKFNEKIEELKQWMGKTLQEEPDQEDVSEDTTINNNCKEQAVVEQPVSNNEETVCVKKTEQGLTLLFKCPCGGGYEVILSGDKCFYRLT